MPLAASIKAIDWNAVVRNSTAQTGIFDRVEAQTLLIAHWVRQLTRHYQNNPATPFLYEMQAAAREVGILLALGRTKAAAGSIRVVVENSLYFVYFVDHPIELTSLRLNKSYYMTKAGVMEYLKAHIPNFTVRAAAFELISALNDWYSDISAIVHGQVPGQWSPDMKITSDPPSQDALDVATKAFERGCQIASQLFIVCLAPRCWDDFSTASKKVILRGVSADKRAALQLNAA